MTTPTTSATTPGAPAPALDFTITEAAFHTVYAVHRDGTDGAVVGYVTRSPLNRAVWDAYLDVELHRFVGQRSTRELAARALLLHREPAPRQPTSRVVVLIAVVV